MRYHMIQLRRPCGQALPEQCKSWARAVVQHAYTCLESSIEEVWCTCVGISDPSLAPFVLPPVRLLGVFLPWRPSIQACEKPPRRRVEASEEVQWKPPRRRVCGCLLLQPQEERSRGDVLAFAFGAVVSRQKGPWPPAALMLLLLKDQLSFRRCMLSEGDCPISQLRLCLKSAKFSGRRVSRN